MHGHSAAYDTGAFLSRPVGLGFCSSGIWRNLRGNFWIGIGMSQPDMKPCPFCGGDKNTICKTDYDGKDSYAVSCRYPECHGAIFTLGYGYFPTVEQAIAAWNTRAVDHAAIREAALREAADVVYKWWFGDGNDLPQELILALIGEKK
jgi:hypothetical protein